jgi:hypothetical protein
MASYPRRHIILTNQYGVISQKTYNIVGSSVISELTAVAESVYWLEHGLDDRKIAVRPPDEQQTFLYLKKHIYTMWSSHRPVLLAPVALYRELKWRKYESVTDLHLVITVKIQWSCTSTSLYLRDVEMSEKQWGLYLAPFPVSVWSPNM